MGRQEGLLDEVRHGRPRGLEQYREGGTGAAAATGASSAGRVAAAQSNSKPPSVSITTNSDDDDDDVEGDDQFGGDGQKLLDISIDATALSAAARSARPGSPKFGAGAKRRQSAGESSPAPQSGQLLDRLLESRRLCPVKISLTCSSPSSTSTKGTSRP